MTTRREPIAGTGKVWINGTLFGEAEKITVKSLAKHERRVGTGVTGESVSDPTGVTIDVSGFVIKRNSQMTKLTRFGQSQEDITVKVTIGNETTVAVCKVLIPEYSTENGKSDFSCQFTGDRQSI